MLQQYASTVLVPCPFLFYFINDTHKTLNKLNSKGTEILTIYVRHGQLERRASSVIFQQLAQPVQLN